MSLEQKKESGWAKALGVIESLIPTWLTKLAGLVWSIGGGKALFIVLPIGFLLGGIAIAWRPQLMSPLPWWTPERVFPGSALKPEQRFRPAEGSESIFSMVLQMEDERKVFVVEPPLEWVGKGAWGQDGKSLYLPAKRKLLQGSSSARVLLRIVPEKGEIVPLKAPDNFSDEMAGLTGIFPSPRGLVLESAGLRFHRLNERDLHLSDFFLGPAVYETKIPFVASRSNVSFTKEAAVFLGEGLHRDKPCPGIEDCQSSSKTCPSIKGCQSSNEEAWYTWKGAYSLVQASNPREAYSLKKMKKGSPNWLFYALGFDLIASNDENFYFLVLEDNPGGVKGCVWESTAETHSEPACKYELPPSIVELPKWPVGQSDSFKMIRGALKNKTLAVGLYASSTQIFILVKNPEDTIGQTEWGLLPMMSDQKQQTQQIQLPSSVPYIQLIPGPISWALIEHSDFPTGGNVSRKIVFIASSKIEQGQ